MSRESSEFPSMPGRLQAEQSTSDPMDDVKRCGDAECSVVLSAANTNIQQVDQVPRAEEAEQSTSRSLDDIEPWGMTQCAIASPAAITHQQGEDEVPRTVQAEQNRSDECTIGSPATNTFVQEEHEGEESSAMSMNERLLSTAPEPPTDSPLEDSSTSRSHRKKVLHTGKGMNGEWHKGIDSRFYLLSYQKSENPVEACIFENDCKEMADALGLNCTADAESQNVFVIDHSTWDVRFFELISRREQQITESLIDDAKDVILEDWIQNKEKDLTLLFYDIRARCRLLQAKPLVIDRWKSRLLPYFTMDKKIDEQLLDVLRVAIKIWRAVDKHYLQPSIRASHLCSDHKQEILNILIKKGEQKISRWEIARTLRYSNQWLTDVLQLACDLFSHSMYCSGFVTGSELENMSDIDRKFLEECCPYLEIICAETIRELETETEIKSRTSRVEDGLQAILYGDSIVQLLREAKHRSVKTLNSLLDILTNWNEIEFVPYQWIWIYYSGHSRGSSVGFQEPFQNCQGALDLTCELFTNAVLCIDSCFPKVSVDPSSRNICLILPNVGRHTTSYNDEAKLSDFAISLSHALRGFNPKQCYSKMTQLFNCAPSQMYSKNLLLDNSSTAETYYCLHCTRKKTECEAKRFIFPHDIRDFFENHVCTSVNRPVVYTNPAYCEPLIEMCFRQ